MPKAARAWCLVAILWGAFVLNYVDRQVVFSIFPILRGELHLSSPQLGAIGAVFTWAYSLAMPLSGRLADVIRRDRLIVTSLLLWSIATFGTGVAKSLPSLLAWRALMGLSESLFMPAALAMIAADHQEAARSRALSLFSTGQFTGIVVGGVLGGWMSAHMGWRAGFIALAGTGVCYAVVLQLAIRNNLHFDQRASEAKRAPFSIFRSKTWLALCAAFFCYCAMLWMVLAWLAELIHSRYGLSLTASGVSATMFVQVGSAIGVVFGGFLGDKYAQRIPGGRFYVSASGLLACAPFAWGLFATDSLGRLQVFSFAFGLLGGLFVANVFAGTYDLIAEINHGFAAGATNFVGGLAGGAAILVTGVLKDRLGVAWLMGWMAAGASIASLLLFGATVLFFRQDQKQATAYKSEKQGPAIQVV